MEVLTNSYTELEEFDKAKIPFPRGDTSESTEYDEVTIPVPWGHITGKWWGPRNVQPVIAIHGWQDNASTYDNLAPLLRDRGISIYCVELPGHGLSSHLPPGVNYYIFWDGIQFVRRIVEYFDWKDIVMIGHSLGGAIAFLYAATYPDEVKKYVTIDIASPYVWPIKKMVENLRPGTDTFLKYEAIGDNATFEYSDMVELMYEAHGGSLTRKSSEIMLRRGMKAAPGEPGRYVFTRDPRLKMSSMGLVTIGQVLEMASKITCEVLSIRANQGLEFDPPEIYDRVLDVIESSARNLERLSFDGTHHLHLNDAEAVAPCIHRFIVSE